MQKTTKNIREDFHSFKSRRFQVFDDQVFVIIFRFQGEGQRNGAISVIKNLVLGELTTDRNHPGRLRPADCRTAAADITL